MSLSAHLKQFLPATRATSFTTSPIGGAISATEVTGSTLNEVFFRMAAEPAGGSPRTQRQKLFVKNTHATEDLTEAKIFLANALDDWGVANSTVGVQSTSSSDTDLKVRYIGRDTNGDPIQIESAVNGTTLVASSDTLTALHSVESRSQATGVLQPSAGALRIFRGGLTLLGEIPQSHYFATNEFQIWLPPSLDDAGTATDASTNPLGATWSRPRTVETALNVANGGTLTAGSAQGVWQLWTLQAGTRPRFDMVCVLGVYGSDFEG